MRTEAQQLKQVAACVSAPRPAPAVVAGKRTFQLLGSTWQSCSEKWTQSGPPCTVHPNNRTMASPLVRIQMSQLTPQEGVPNPEYVNAATKLRKALQNDHACILKFDLSEAAIVKNGLAHAYAKFEEQKEQKPQKLDGKVKLDGDIVGGYHALPEKEIYNVMLGERPHDQPFVESFCELSRASRHVLRALAWGLHVDTSLFEPLLDSAPLRPSNQTTSMLSCFAYKAGNPVKEEGGESSACPQHIDQGLLTLVTSNQPGLQILSKGDWTLVDANLADDELVLFTGQALTEATAGLIAAAEHRIAHVSSASVGRGRLSAAFKCRPRLEATFDRGPLYVAHPGVGIAYVTAKRLLPVGLFVADMTARYESVNDVKKVKKEEYESEEEPEPVTKKPKLDKVKPNRGREGKQPPSPPRRGTVAGAPRGRRREILLD